MQLPKSEQLNIVSLSRLFDNKAECYKLFWFQAILNHVCKGQQEIRNWLQSSTDSAVTRYKRTLTLNVPFRLQAPFLESFRGDTWNCGSRELAGRINRQDRLMYYVTGYDGLETRIRIVPGW